MTDPALRGNAFASSLAEALTPANTKPRGIVAWVLLNLLVCAAYSIAGLVVVLFGIGPAKISPIYPPAGIAVAATYLLGWRVLPAVFVGQFMNGFPLFENPNTTIGMYALANTGTGIGSILEALISLAIMRRFTGTWHPFERSAHVVIFLLGSCLAAALVCGTIGTFSLWAGGFVPDDEIQITWVTFFLADAAGIAVFGAMVLAWYREPKLDSGIVVNSALILIAVLVIAGVGAVSRHPVDYLFLPLLLWAGLPRGSAWRHARGDGDHRRHHHGDDLWIRLVRRQNAERIDPAARGLHRGDHLHRLADHRRAFATARSRSRTGGAQSDAGATRPRAHRRSGREEPPARGQAGSYR